MLKGIIIDDESGSRESLKLLLEEFCEQVRVVALCSTVAEGIEAIEKEKPHVVFLDIQMRQETGFDLLTKLESIDFEIVFTTAYSEYAINAFKFSAIDYLLKPINIEELRDAIRKVEQKKTPRIPGRMDLLQLNLHVDSADHYQISLPVSDGLVFLKLKDILYFEASSNYTIVHTTDQKKYVIAKSLKEYEELLFDYDFFRVHQSYLINLREVKRYIRGTGGQVVLSNNATLAVAKRKKESFLNRMTSIS